MIEQASTPKNTKKSHESNSLSYSKNTRKSTTARTTETRRGGPTTEQRTEVRTVLHEILVMKPMREGQYKCTSSNTMERLIEDLEKILYNNFETNLQYMMAYRRVNKYLRQDGFRDKLLKGLINANEIIKVALDGKSKDSDVKMRRKKTIKKDSTSDSTKSKPFSIFDLIESRKECSSLSSTSAAISTCDTSVLQKSGQISPTQDAFVEET